MFRLWYSALASWQAELQVYRAADDESAAIRAQHMQSVGRLTPLLVAGNLAGGVLLSVSLSATLPPWQWLGWLALLSMVCGVGLANWWKHRRAPRARVSPLAVRRMVSGVFVLSLLWAAATAGWLAAIAPEQQLLLATLVVGIMCGGAFALASVPQAAVVWLATMTGGTVLGLWRDGGSVSPQLTVMVLFYAALLSLCALTSARIGTARLVSERQAERQREWIGLLLRDFEENSADLLWETDAKGRFVRLSGRLAKALYGTEQLVQGAALLSALVARAPAADPAVLAPLADAMAAGRPFRDVAVPVQTVGGPMWWSFSGKPLLSAAGAVQGWRGVVTDITPARLARERLEQLAHFDSLTGLANRLQLADRLRRASETAAACGTRLALICIDVDHFKFINDTQGHAIGDAVLVEVARRMRHCMRPQDLATRLGGDEFALLIDPVSDEMQAQAIARRLVEAMLQPLELGERSVRFSVSVGVALGDAGGPGGSTDLDALLGNADLALYAAKEAGRGRFQLFSSDLGDRHRRHVQVSRELRGALEAGQFSLAWQPQVDIETRRVVGTEVLLRWSHPELGFVSPAEFIPIAETSGQIREIGLWVLEQACAGAVVLHESISVSVNASPVQLMREDFVESVRRALARTGLPASRLKIEITESLFMDAVPVALANLHGLRKLGVKIALDDFGTGFSSLAYLLRFPFDLLKIDRAFVLEMMARDEAKALVRTIVEMARTLGMGTIAEGVEDLAQLEVLRQAGCESVQGYLVARPMTLAQLVAMLAMRQVREATVGRLALAAPVPVPDPMPFHAPGRGSVSLLTDWADLEVEGTM
ncbi:MAG: EAL domain-containing protein [Rubrivivax sp.]